jgi:hemerythrin-like domain-containing protein
MEPLKRHAAMSPLSRHHHHALVIALKINKTFKEADVSRETVLGLKEEVVRFWENGGQAHFREEEEILLPAYSRYSDIHHDEIIAMLLEHVTIRGLASAIREQEEPAAPLRQLSGLLERHVRREERVIFPMIEKALPEHELEKLAPYFHEFHTDCRLNGKD